MTILPVGVGQSSGITPAVRRLPLNRYVILTSAVTLIDQSGLGYLTMRRLGAALGVEGMTLYGYVRSRQDLLDGIVDLVVGELYVNDDAAPGQWPDQLRRLAHGVRRIALAHPRVFPLIATGTTAAPWVRPPIRSPRWTEDLLDLLHRSGFPDPAVVTAYRVFTSFLLGHLLPEVAAAGMDDTITWRSGWDSDGHLDLLSFPQLSRLHPELSREHSTAEFDEALSDLLHRLHLLHEQSASLLGSGPPRRSPPQDDRPPPAPGSSCIPDRRSPH